MQHEKKRIADGFLSLEGGMDGGRAASIIGRNQAAFASNVRFRGGKPVNRPGFKQLPLMFRKFPQSAINTLAFVPPAMSTFTPKAIHTVLVTVDSTVNFPSSECIIDGVRYSILSVGVNTVTLFHSDPNVVTSVATVTAAGYTQPAVNSNVSVTVVSSAAFGVGDFIFITDGGFYRVESVNSATQISVKNLGYAGYPAPAAAIGNTKDVYKAVPPNMPITFTYEVADTDLQAAFEDGLFQGAWCYGHRDKQGIIFTVIGGRFFTVDPIATISTNADGSYIQKHRVTERVLEINLTVPTTAAFNAPGIDQTGGVTVESTALMSLSRPAITIGAYTYTITAIQNSTTIVVRNSGHQPYNELVPAGTSVNYVGPDTNSPVHPKAYFCQAEQFLIIQNGLDKPLIFDGTSLRRASERDTAGYPEVPVGTAMAYGNGRLWVAVFGSYFAAGDIVGGPTGTSPYGYNDALLKFSENTYLNEGGYFRVPANAGDITAMAFAAVPDTSLGQGSLLVFTPSHILTVNAPTDRDTWKNLQFPIQTIAVIGNGGESDKSVVLVNGDAFYRSKDGIRSFQTARREMGQWGYTPQSNEVSPILNADTYALLRYGSAVLFDNRLLVTADPRPVPNGAFFEKIVALDFHPISAMTTRTPPAYDGEWHSDVVDFYQLFTGRTNDGEEHCWFMGRDANQDIQLWEITKAARFDFHGTATPVNIASCIDTTSYNFGFGLSATPSDYLSLKELVMGELFVAEIAGTVTFTVSYRPDQAPDFSLWHTWSETVQYRDCDADYVTPPCRTPSSQCFKGGYRPRMRLPWPTEVCETGQNKPSRLGYEFQARLQWSGFAQINKFRMQAHEKQEEAFGECR